MDLTGLDLGAWLTESDAVVLLYEYDCVAQVFIGHVVHPMREVRYGRDGGLVSCCFLAGESQTVEHEQKLHAALHLDRKLDLENDAVYVTNIVEWMERSGEAALAPPRQYNFETQEWNPVPAAQAPHEDWVEITDLNHVLRAGIDYIDENGMGWWTKQTNDPLLSIAVMGACHPSSTFKFRCLREHHPNFAPARRQDSAGAGIYDEVPPPIHPEINEEKLKEVADRKTLDDPLSRFNVPEPPAELEVIPAPLREWRVLTPGGCWETVVADEVCTCNTSVDMYQNKRQVGFFVNPQAVIAGREVDTKPAVPIITIEQLIPLSDSLDHLYRLIVHGVSSVAEKDAVRACIERFNNLVKFSK